MITIEVLVSMLILFLVIATSFSNIKFFNILNEKKESYEEQYVTVLSLKDKLSSTICKTSLNQEGSYNGFSYNVTCTKEKELRTYVVDRENYTESGNYGNRLMQLYKVELELFKEKYTRKYSYYKTIYSKS